MQLNEQQTINQKYITAYLTLLKSEGYISNFFYDDKKAEVNFIIEVDKDRHIELTSNLVDRYKAIFEGEYEEWTDYVTSKTTFIDLIDWLKRFIDAYVKNEYLEEIYRDKKTGKIGFRKLIFNNKHLGRRQLMSASTPFFGIKKSLGRYTKTIKRPESK